MELKIPADNLLGLKVNGHWNVVDKISKAYDSTGGNFSITYIVEDESGNRGFLKALDYSRAFRSPERVSVLESMTKSFNFEKEILLKCNEKNMDRVVKCIEFGSTTLGDDDFSVVDFIILELADGDVRSVKKFEERYDFAWALRCLHHISVGLKQLHSANIAHQDLKPSNVVIFKGGKISKLSDVGRASYKGHEMPHDHLDYAGDPSYAPIELLYGYYSPDWNKRRYSCDFYLLGSMMFFFVTGSGLTSTIYSHLDDSYRHHVWSGTYSEVLPYLVDAFSSSLEEFASMIPFEGLRSEMLDLAMQLCYPEVEKRGHKNFWKPGDQYSLERIITKFDVLASKLECSLFR